MRLNIFVSSRNMKIENDINLKGRIVAKEVAF